MDNNMVEIGKGAIDKQQFELKSVALVVHGMPEFQTWEKAGKALKYMGGSVQWWLGDWINYGEGVYGEKYSQALDATDYEYDTLKHVAYVANRIEMGRRRLNLSWSHHQEVAPLEPEKQDHWLDMAEKKGWTRNELRRHIREAKKYDWRPEPEDTALTLLKCLTRHYSRRYPAWIHECEGCPLVGLCRGITEMIEKSTLLDEVESGELKKRVLAKAPEEKIREGKRLREQVRTELDRKRTHIPAKKEGLGQWDRKKAQIKKLHDRKMEQITRVTKENSGCE